MATDAQINANRANAEHSTGPKTEEGKANSCKNNTRWGFRGAFTVLPSESQEEFDTLLDRLRAEHKPQCIVEDILILKMAQHFWLSQRAQKLCDLSMDPDTPASDPEKLFALWLRYQVTNDRAFHKSLDQLLKIRAQRFKERLDEAALSQRAEDSRIGFERQNREAEEHQNRERQQAERTRHTAEHEHQRVNLHKLVVSLAEAKLDHQKLPNAALDPANFCLKNLGKAA